MNYAEARLSLGYDHRMTQLEMNEELYRLIENMLDTMHKYSNKTQQCKINDIRRGLYNLHKQYEEEYMDYNKGIELLQGLKKEDKSND